MRPKLRELLGRGLWGLKLSPAPKERIPGLSYHFAQMWGRGEEGGVRCESYHQTSKNGVRLLITETKMYENREMDHNDEQPILPGLRTRVTF